MIARNTARTAALPAPASADRFSVDMLTERIRATGTRATLARIRVLKTLALAPTPLSHHDIETALGDEPIDRVTLYRVLDWAVHQGIACKQADNQRTWRFSLQTQTSNGIPSQRRGHLRHSHFHCEDCGKIFCLDTPLPRPPHLPQGFSLHHLEYAVKGQCADCNRTAS